MKLKITVHGIAYEVEVEVLDIGEGFPASASLPRPRLHQASPPPATRGPATPPPAAPPPAGPGVDNRIVSPISGTVVELKCAVGKQIAPGQEVLVIEAMKMNTAITAATAGKVKSIAVAVGDAVREGQLLVELD